jgi:hypothetical protein
VDTLTADDVINRVVEAVVDAGSMAKLGNLWGCSKGYLSGVCSDKVPPGRKVLRPLGLEGVRKGTHVVGYRKAVR